MKRTLSSFALAVALLGGLSTAALAIGGPSGAHIDYAVPGKIGEVVVNPYDSASNGGDQKRRLHASKRQSHYRAKAGRSGYQL